MEDANRLVSEAMLRVTAKFKDQFDRLSHVTQIEVGREILRLKEILVATVDRTGSLTPDDVDDAVAKLHLSVHKVPRGPQQ
jgi:hypothetical protein